VRPHRHIRSPNSLLVINESVKLGLRNRSPPSRLFFFVSLFILFNALLYVPVHERDKPLGPDRDGICVEEEPAPSCQLPRFAALLACYGPAHGDDSRSPLSASVRSGFRNWRVCVCGWVGVCFFLLPTHAFGINSSFCELRKNSARNETQRTHL
jgi:hypothetical protein